MHRKKNLVKILQFINLKSLHSSAYDISKLILNIWNCSLQISHLHFNIFKSFFLHRIIKLINIDIQTYLTELQDYFVLMRFDCTSIEVYIWLEWQQMVQITLKITKNIKIVQDKIDYSKLKILNWIIFQMSNNCNGSWNNAKNCI